MRIVISSLAAAVVASSLVGLGCTADGGIKGSIGECPPNSTDAEIAGYDVVSGRCMTCHSTALTGTARQGAPAYLNFDDPSVLKSESESMYSEAVSGSMPPDYAAKITGTDLENMRIWLACGAEPWGHD